MLAHVVVCHELSLRHIAREELLRYVLVELHVAAPTCASIRPLLSLPPILRSAVPLLLDLALLPVPVLVVAPALVAALLVLAQAVVAVPVLVARV